MITSSVGHTVHTSIIVLCKVYSVPLVFVVQNRFCILLRLQFAHNRNININDNFVITRWMSPLPGEKLITYTLSHICNIKFNPTHKLFLTAETQRPVGVLPERHVHNNIMNYRPETNDKQNRWLIEEGFISTNILAPVDTTVYEWSDYELSCYIEYTYICFPRFTEFIWR